MKSWLEGPSPARLLPAIAEVKEDWGFLPRKEKEAKGTVADGSVVSLPYRWILFIDRSEEGESAMQTHSVFTPGLTGENVWTKRWKVNRRILFVWMKRQGIKGKEEFSACYPHRIRGVTALGVPVQKSHHDEN